MIQWLRLVFWREHPAARRKRNDLRWLNRIIARHAANPARES